MKKKTGLQDDYCNPLKKKKQKNPPRLITNNIVGTQKQKKN